MNEQGDKAFELRVRALIDSKFDRAPAPDNPFLRLMRGELPIEECRRTYVAMWPSLQVFNRVLLPRLLERAPELPLRVELMSVIAPEYAGTLEEAHPTLFRRFVLALGAEDRDINEIPDLEAGPWRQEVEALRAMSWCELLARLLVGESLGPVVFAEIAAALKRSYGLSDKALYYFTLHSTHDKRDTEVLFDLLGREARDEVDREAAVRVIERSFDEGRYRLYGCRLADAEERYSYTRLFDRRAPMSAREEA